jgi:AcrR family transcriptional regulator
MINARRGRSRSAPRRPRSVPEATRARILDTAERLFADRGVDAVSVRAVLKEAGVNVALAHYHFGSREGLIQELLKDRAAPVAADTLRAVEEADARGPGTSLEDLLRAYYRAATRSLATRPDTARLYAQLQHSNNPAIRAMGEEVMSRTLRRLADALLKRMPPGVPMERVLLRLYMVASVPSYFATHWDRVLRSARKRLPKGVVPTPEMLTEELTAFSSAGLRAGAAPGAER